jgi:glucosylglycerate phosphorylase
MKRPLEELIAEIYGKETAATLMPRLRQLMQSYRGKIAEPVSQLSNGSALALGKEDVIMITYGDQFSGPEGTPLSYLHRFLEEDLEGTVSGVHILPFSPYSSDDGFSVIDYREVDPNLGSWDEIRQIAGDFRLMADLVLNHCSAGSDWFAEFLKWKAPYRDYFITVPPGTDTSQVFRPRALPLLTPFDTADGEKLVWTTFSPDQVDLNYANPELFLEMADIMLSYLAEGAQVIRLDAIAYLWKELGTSCLHHPKTHLMVQVFRALFDELAPWAIIITETNVPHAENISYFGDGDNEAHMVYNFSLPPLTLDAFIREDATHLSDWARSLTGFGEETSFFNFLASHDGVGVLPAKGYLSDEEIEELIATVEARGGRVSYKSTPTGDIPYELNINYLSAVTDPALPEDQRARVFLASQAVMLAFQGVPGIYVHSLLGSENWQEGVEKTGANRTINRRKFDYQTVATELLADGSLRFLVFEGYKQLIRARAKEAAFDPASPQEVLATPANVFGIARGPYQDSGPVYCLVNVSGADAEVVLPKPGGAHGGFRDLVSGDLVFPHPESKDTCSVELSPYEIMWLMSERSTE